MNTRLSFGLFICGLLLYLLVITHFTEYMQKKPIEEKLGYVPGLKVIKIISADQKELMAASLVTKVLMYFGGIIGTLNEGKHLSGPPDFQGMSRLLHGAVQLDPYNTDAYYFAQSFLTWDVKQYKIANNLLDYGMRYRTWDWYLPFFAGFNSAYFMKDYKMASKYYKRAGELSGQDLHKSLAGRYMQESGQTEMAIAYLTAIEKTERNDAMKKNYQVRLQAFQEVLNIEQAIEKYKKAHNAIPTNLDKLLVTGYLSSKPVDPYGGRFYLDPNGKVATTSKFAFATKNK